jgi:hypothetical protein
VNVEVLRDGFKWEIEAYAYQRAFYAYFEILAGISDMMDRLHPGKMEHSINTDGEYMKRLFLT